MSSISQAGGAAPLFDLVQFVGCTLGADASDPKRKEKKKNKKRTLSVINVAFTPALTVLARHAVARPAARAPGSLV